MRGGKRDGAGRKPKWRCGETTTIRVPKRFVREVMTYATRIDALGLTPAKVSWLSTRVKHCDRIISRLAGDPQYTSVVQQLHRQQSAALAELAELNPSDDF